MANAKTVSLTLDQQDWIASRVADGEFRSFEDAVHRLLDERIAERSGEAEDDLAWAKPYVDEALVEMANRDVITDEDHNARMLIRIAALQQ